MVDSIPYNGIWAEVYTDGSCFGNGQDDATAGYGVFWDDTHPFNEYGPVLNNGPNTNNKAELIAVLRAVTRAVDNKVSHLTVFTDSNYIVKIFNEWIYNWFQNGWRNGKGYPVANQGLIKNIWHLKRFIKVRFTHVYAHGDDYCNTMADRFARRGAMGKRFYRTDEEAEDED